MSNQNKELAVSVVKSMIDQGALVSKDAPASVNNVKHAIREIYDSLKLIDSSTDTENE